MEVFLVIIGCLIGALVGFWFGLIDSEGDWLHDMEEAKADAYANGWKDRGANAMKAVRAEQESCADRVRTAGLERDRLARELTAYDLCECNMRRHRHADGVAHAFGRCSGFRLKTPADPLETAVATHDGSGRIDYETVTARKMREGQAQKQEPPVDLATISEFFHSPSPPAAKAAHETDATLTE